MRRAEPAAAGAGAKRRASGRGRQPPRRWRSRSGRGAGARRRGARSRRRIEWATRAPKRFGARVAASRPVRAEARAVAVAWRGEPNAASADRDIAPTRYGPFSRTLSNRNRPLTAGTLVRKRPPAKRNTADPSEAVPSRTEAPPGASRTDSSLAEGARRRGGASGEGAERASSWRTVRRARITGVQAARATAATARRAGTRRTRWPCTARHTA